MGRLGDVICISVISKEDVVFENIEQNLNKWTIPKVNSTKIYNKGVFHFRQTYIIKTLEKSISISNNIESIKLLTSQIIETLKKDYKYLLLGLVQIAIKPLKREKHNTSLLTYLRENRHNKFHDSLIGIIESSLYSGLVYFDCFPNFSSAFMILT